MIQRPFSTFPFPFPRDSNVILSYGDKDFHKNTYLLTFLIHKIDQFDSKMFNSVVSHTSTKSFSANVILFLQLLVVNFPTFM